SAELNRHANWWAFRIGSWERATPEAYPARVFAATGISKVTLIVRWRARPPRRALTIRPGRGSSASHRCSPSRVAGEKHAQAWARSTKGRRSHTGYCEEGVGHENKSPQMCVCDGRRGGSLCAGWNV